MSCILTKKNFDTLLDVSNALSVFIDQCINNSTYQAELSDTNDLQQDYNILWKIILWDIIKCVQLYGNNINKDLFTTRDGQCFLAFCLICHPKHEQLTKKYSYADFIDYLNPENSDYSDNQRLCLRLKQSYKDITTYRSKYVFGFTDLLQTISLLDKIDYYLLLLFKFSCIVANVENKEKFKNNWNREILRQDESSNTNTTTLSFNVSSNLYNDNQDDSLQIEDEDSSQIACQIDTNTESGLDKLEQLIGLQNVKKEIRTLSNYIKIKAMREERGLKSSPISFHCVFSGNPGTGKTTVARILSEIFKNLGVLSKGHLIETDRSGLIAEYVGQTAIKTNKIIDSALDGVLFIDEAYTLAGGNNDFGNEAIATLLKRMEDDRERLVVILAGYRNEMEFFIKSNPGLRSRFNRVIDFPDYSVEELCEIFKKMVYQNDYKLSDTVLYQLHQMFLEVVENKPFDFGNARFIRNLFEKTISIQANRLLFVDNCSNEMLREITIDDIKKSLNS